MSVKPLSYGSGVNAVPGWNDNMVTGTGSYSSSGSGFAGSGVPSIAPPSISQYQFSPDTQNTPTYMQNYGMMQNQNAFQKSVNLGIKLGSAAQGYMAALNAKNMANMGVMSQAGQARLGIDTAQASNQNAYNDALLKMYGIQVQQRGQDVYASSQNYQSNGMGGIKMGGGSGSTPAVPYQAGPEQLGGGVNSQLGSGSFVNSVPSSAFNWSY